MLRSYPYQSKVTFQSNMQRVSKLLEARLEEVVEVQRRNEIVQLEQQISSYYRDNVMGRQVGRGSAAHRSLLGPLDTDLDKFKAEMRK